MEALDKARQVAYNGGQSFLFSEQTAFLGCVQRQCLAEKV